MKLITNRHVAIITPKYGHPYQDLLIERRSMIGVIDDCSVEDHSDFRPNDTVYFTTNGEVLMIKDKDIEKLIVPLSNIYFKIKD